MTAPAARPLVRELLSRSAGPWVSRRELLLEPFDQRGRPQVAARLCNIVGTAGVGERLVDLALQFISERAIFVCVAVRQDLLGIEPDRVAEVGDGSVGFASAQMSLAAPEKGECVGRLELDSLVEVRDRVRELLLFEKDVGAPVIGIP